MKIKTKMAPKVVFMSVQMTDRDLLPQTLVSMWTVTEIFSVMETHQPIRAAGAGQCRQETSRLTLVTLTLIIR